MAKRISLDPQPYSPQSALRCPVCSDGDGLCLHQDAVDAYFRSGEDSDRGTHVICDADGAEVTWDMAGNPSDRRDGLRIAFRCETCDNGLRLVIAQHKGLTYLYWEVAPSEK